MKTKKLILLDAHAIIHRAYHALPDFATSKGEPTGALYGLSAMIIKLITDLKPDYIVACFDLPEPTHRHEALKTYKAGRAELDNALIVQLERAKDVFTAFGIPIYSHSGFEADDIIGTIVHGLKRDKGIEIVIASGDMDTLQLVDGKKVQVYTLKKGISDTILYDEKKVISRFGFSPLLLTDYKGLRGDPSDNIVGVEGIGEKTATYLVSTFGTIENIYQSLDKANISERLKNILLENKKEAIFSKNLTTIRTDAPIHFVLPAPWQITLKVEKLNNLFAELEFKTMSDRVKKLVPTTTVETRLPQKREETKELCLALWVIDSNFTNPTIEDVLRFTKTETAEDAKKMIYKELDKRQVRKVFEEIEKPILSVVENMDKRGIKVDKIFLNQLSVEYHKELARLEKMIWKEAGEDFNVNSPKVLSNILFKKLELAGKNQKKTSTGALSTKESVLIELKHSHLIIPLILEYRELSKLLSTYIDAIPPLLDKSSRLHSTFLQAGATTGRMASNSPNLQNIPNKTSLGRAIRNAFVAEKGFKLISLDYSQIELRIAAILSKDKKLIEIFKNGIDIHTGVAMRIFDVAKEKVDKSMRTRAKTINFGILYGMGVNALKVNLGVERKEAQEFYSQYFKTFSDLSKYIEKTKVETAKRGYTETLFGRRRYFTEFSSPLPYVRAQAERMAVNAPLQGTQADIIKIAMKKINDEIIKKKQSDNIHLVLQVHDELVYEIKNDLVAEYAPCFKELMEEVLSVKETHGVPIVAEVHVGDNWGEMEEFKI